MIYPLRNLKEDILSAMKLAMVYFKRPPARFIFDFYNKLVKGPVRDYLVEKGGQWRLLLQDDNSRMA